MEEYSKVLKTFFNEFSQEISFYKKDNEGIKLHLIPLYYNSRKNKGVCTIIKKGVENKKYNEQDYPIILKFPGVMKIEQIYAKTIKIKEPNESYLYYLLIMEESLSNLYFLNRTLHLNDGYILLKIISPSFIEIFGNNLLKYMIRQLIYLMEFIDRSNLIFEKLSLKDFFVTKKDFLLRLYNFKNIINLDDKEIPQEQRAGKKSLLLNNKNSDMNEKFELFRKDSYFQLGKCIFDLIFGNIFFRNENEKSTLFEEKKIDLLMRYIKKIKAKNMDPNLKSLLISLIDYEKENRPNIEEIFRNKFIHQDYHIINDIISNYEKDIIKIIIEFAKNDYLVKLDSCFKKKIKDINININNKIINNNGIEKKCKTIRTGRFIFKRKDKKKKNSISSL
jgi:hypothetical protein